MHSNNLILVGVIGSAYGIYGWMRVLSFTEETINILNYQPWYIKNNNKWCSLKFEKYKWYNNKLIIKLKNIVNRNMVKELTNCEIFIKSSQLTPLQKGEYYWKDLIGCQVYTTEGYNLGYVINIMSTGFNDILIIKDKNKYCANLQERFIPFVNNQIIKDVDIASRIIKIAWKYNF